MTPVWVIMRLVVPVLLLGHGGFFFFLMCGRLAFFGQERYGRQALHCQVVPVPLNRHETSVWRGQAADDFFHVLQLVTFFSCDENPQQVPHPAAGVVGDRTENRVRADLNFGKMCKLKRYRLCHGTPLFSKFCCLPSSPTEEENLYTTT